MHKHDSNKGLIAEWDERMGVGGHNRDTGRVKKVASQRDGAGLDVLVEGDLSK